MLWIPCENGRHFASLVSLRNEVWGPSAEVPCWRRVGSVTNWLKICFSVCSVGCFLRLCYGWWENVIPPSSVCEILARIFLELNFLAPEIQDRERKNIVCCLCSVSDCKEMFGKSVIHVKSCLRFLTFSLPVSPISLCWAKQILLALKPITTQSCGSMSQSEFE